MSNYKEVHYWTQLRATLTAGQWTAKCPAKAPTGANLSWSELLRKFNKHCVGFRDVAEMASQTRTLALLLATRSMDDEDNNTNSDVDFPLLVGDECVLPHEHVEEAKDCYEVLKKLHTHNSNVRSSNSQHNSLIKHSSRIQSQNSALAYYAYALGNPSECLSHIPQVLDISNVSDYIPTKESRSNSLAPSTALTVPASSARTSIASAGGSMYATMMDSLWTEIKDGRSWAMVEALRSVCLQGQHSLPSPPDVYMHFLKTKYRHVLREIVSFGS